MGRAHRWLGPCWRASVIKLTRLNHNTVALNPDVILWAEQSPDTTLCLVGGEKVIVRESLDELIDRVIEFRRKTLSEFPRSRADVERAE
jgi:flagellar protein FlbD